MLFLLAACTATTEPSPIDDVDCDTTQAVGWSEETHAKGTDGQADVLWPDDQVLRLDIKICPDDFEAMQEELEEFYGGETGGGGPGGGGPGGGGPGGGGGGGGGEPTFEDPSYQPALVGFEGQTWPSVGIRYKGNSSLSQGYQNGSEKLPFRLAFDHYEDEVEEVDNQRFWGFKDLKFSSAFEDDSVIKDLMLAESFREAGVPAARGGFVRVYVDVGDGAEFWGVYTAFEDPSGEMLDDWFGDDSGNAYKPDGTAAALGSFDADHFEKKTNEDEADFGDVEAFIAALNSSESDAETWRSELEATFDVDSFLRYLALNNLVENWDSYGNMTHNYYLYGDPAQDGRLVWIPWDFNMSYGWSANMEPLSLDMDEVGSDWPLVRELMDDPVYEEMYAEHMEDLLSGAFSIETQSARLQAHHDLIAPYVAEEEDPFTSLSSQSAFESSVQDLIDHVEDRHDAAWDYLE